jgi:hypothetical protein
MFRPVHCVVSVVATALFLQGCAKWSADVKPLPANPADFSGWSCEQLYDEQDSVQQRAADLAYTVDERAGTNILALGVGLAVFWPALLAMRPDGLEAQDLARLRGRFDALKAAATGQNCAVPDASLPPARAAQLPVVLGERLVYEERRGNRGAMTETALRLSALRRGEVEYQQSSGGLPKMPSAANPNLTVIKEPPPLPGRWLHDLAGNVLEAPTGSLRWPFLLRGELTLGQVTAGDMLLVGDPMARARMRGQVVAVGPQTVAGRRFDVVVVELFGDAPAGDAYTRVDGALVVDRASGVLLRLDLRSAQPAFSLQRRLVRVEPPVP